MLEMIIRTALSLLAAVLIENALAGLIRIKKGWWNKGVLFAASWTISVMIIYIGDWFNLLVSLVIFLSCVLICCEGSWLKRCILGILFVSIVSSFNGFYDNSVGHLFHAGGMDVYFNIMYQPGRFLFALFLYLGIHFQKLDRDFDLSPSLWRLMLFLCLPPFGIIFSLTALRSPFYVGGPNLAADAALFLTVMFSFAGLLWEMIVLERHQRLERENLLALHNRIYYEAMEQQQFEIRRLRHDLSNHFQVLLALPDARKNSYIEEMLDKPAFVKVLAYCGDKTVNAVLSAKESMMRQKGIRFYVKADIPKELPFEKGDICALFANALDNAAESCVQVEEERREVRLDARSGKGLLAVSITNSCPRKTDASGAVDPAERKEILFRKKGKKNQRTEEIPGRKREMLPKTTKTDKENHGYGLRSIREAVRKYGGNMEIRQEEGEFTLFFYCPLGE